MDNPYSGREKLGWTLYGMQPLFWLKKEAGDPWISRR